MEPRDVSAYLERIGYVGSREPTAQTLRALHRAHLATVPFENLDIHAGRPIRLDLAAFFRKIVGERRGGFCYELNGLFGDLLSSMGFQMSLLSARVARGAGGFGPEFDHLVLLVTSQGRWIADVGFGRSFQEPLSLDHPSEHEADGLVYDVIEVGDELHMRSRSPGDEPRAEYALSLCPRRLEEFAAMCEYHQTSPQSHFTKQTVCSMPTARGRVTVSGRTLSITERDSRQEIPLHDDAAVAAALQEHFGIRMPLRPGA